MQHLGSTEIKDFHFQLAKFESIISVRSNATILSGPQKI